LVRTVRELVMSRGAVDGAVRRMTADRFDLTTTQPVDAELDGDAVGPRRHMKTRTLAGALLVRVPCLPTGTEAA
jgi:diacylglycerol kinase family enzyme